MEIPDDQLTRASLPGLLGNLGVRSAVMLASSNFLAVSHINLLTPKRHPWRSYPGIWRSLHQKSLSHVNIPAEPANHYQKVWDAVVSTTAYEDILSMFKYSRKSKTEGCQSSACWRLVKCSSRVGFVGLRLSDEEIRITVEFHLGFSTCQLHQWICSTQVDARRLHDLSCRRSAPRHSDTLWSMTSCGEASRRPRFQHAREPIDLSQTDGVTGQTTSVGRGRTRYFCPVTYYSYCHECQSSSWQSNFFGDK